MLHFKFSFNEKGKKVKNKPGKLYDRVDFNPTYFPDDTFSCYNSLQEGCKTTFPVYIHSYVRFSKQL